MNLSSLSNYSARFKFHGKSAHAAAAPHLGRSALDAVELMNVGSNYLREHMIPEARVHYAITNTGGVSPNVVQPFAEVVYLIRAPHNNQVQELYERVLNIAKGAALMTGTSLEIEFEGTASNLIPNTVLAKIMQNCIEEIGTPSYSDTELQYARDIRSTLSQEDLNAAYVGFPKEAVKILKDKEIVDIIFPLMPEFTMSASTDVGDVSWKVPTIQCVTSCWAFGTPLHTWQIVSQSATTIAFKGMLQAGKIMAQTAIKVMENSDLLKKAQEEWKERLDVDTYVSQIPEDIDIPSKARTI